MEVITMESSAYKELMEKIERIAESVTRVEPRKEPRPDVWLSSADVMVLLGISRRISYAILRGACRYHLSEVVRMVEESIVPCRPERLEEFKQHYLLRTGSRGAKK